MLLEPATSNGTFTFRAPDRVRWDYDRPDSMVVLYNGDIMTTYHPDQGRAQRVKLGRKHRRFVRVLAGTQPLDDLASQFRITMSDPGAPEPYRLTLEPTHSVIKKRLDTVLLEIDRQLLLPVVVEYREKDGDSTRYEFLGLEVDPDISEGHFCLELGSDVDVETIDATSGIG
jgi:outer membrane lipoprotein-sorting protein